MTRRGSDRKKMCSFIFGAQAPPKISSCLHKWFSSFNINKKECNRSNGHVNSKGNNSDNVLWNLVKSHLNIDPKQ